MALRRALIFRNPGYEQDIEAMLWARSEAVEVHTYSTVSIGEHFLELFPMKVLGLDYALYHEPARAAARAKWQAKARAIISDIYSVFPFDVAIAPADDTPYWRDIALAAESLGAPFVVLYKEATHPEGQLTTIARRVREHFPVTARHVLVNSRRTGEYLRHTGADPSAIHVVGQPRFDAYARGHPFPSYDALGIPIDPDRRTILFLSYEAMAYHDYDTRLARERDLDLFFSATSPEELWRRSDLAPADSWIHQRCRSELALLEHAASSRSNLVVKPHPQMHGPDLAFDRAWVRWHAERLGLRCAFYADAGIDARALVGGADIVVGFQTTSLLEAMAIGKHVIYAELSSPTDAQAGMFIPFKAWRGALAVATTPAELLDALTRPTASDGAARSEIVRDWLGPFDGSNARRAWETLARIRAERTPTAVEIRARSVLDAGRGRRLRAALLRARAGEISWSLARGALAPFRGRAERARAIDVRVGRAALASWRRAAECAAALHGVPVPDLELVGPPATPLAAIAARFVVRRLSRRRPVASSRSR